MATNEPSAAQQMSELAEAERKKAFARNEYNPVKENDGYDVNHPNANSDGDNKGRGTASFLGVHGDAGTQTDQKLRKDLIKGNLYNSKNEYYSNIASNEATSSSSTIELTP